MARAKFSVASLMNDQSKAQSVTAEEQSRTVAIPLDMIDPSPENLYSMDGIEELAASIEMVGLLQHPLVRQKPDGRYAVIAGHRRRAAMQMLAAGGNEKYKVVPCTVIRSDDDVMAELQLIMANSTTRIMTDADKVYQAERIRELLLSLKRGGYKFGMRMREVIAQMMGVSSTNAGRYESIIKHLIDGWKEEFKVQNITITTAAELARRPAEEQEKMLAEYRISGTVSFQPTGKPAAIFEHTGAAAQEQGDTPPWEAPGSADDDIENGMVAGADADAGGTTPQGYTPKTTDQLIDEARKIREEQQAERAVAIVNEGMENGMVSGAKIEAERPDVPIIIHLAKAYYEAILSGRTVYFEEFGTGKRVTARVEVVK